MQLISPQKIFRGNGAWLKALPQIKNISKRPLLLGRSEATNIIRQKIYRELLEENLDVHISNLKYDCCYEDLERLEDIIQKKNCDSIIATGGGKVLDTGKFLGDYFSIPVITIPLSASTCAGWTALSNIYSKDGQFIQDVELKSCPEIFVLDHTFIKTAPKRTLSSGIADALAKWYESSLTSSEVEDGLVQQAIQISRVLRDQLLIYGESAYQNQVVHNLSWCNVVEGCALTAGLIGGIGGEKCRTAAAHAFHNAITQIVTTHKPLHGEIVGVGILLQLKLEETKNDNKLANQSIKQLLELMNKLNLPTTIAELGINVFENNNLQKISEFTCRDKSEIHFLPFETSQQDIIEIISNFEKQAIKVS